MADDCLISVTSFFRDPGVFRALAQQVLPLLLNDARSDEPLRVWVPGCATGEEVYSIAMCLLEQAAELSRNPTLQIFATDLSESALSKAREGIFSVNVARDVSPQRLRRFFTKAGDHYQINKAIREMCVFARHDVTRDPPYSRIDLVSCRNVLIYFEPALQEAAFATFHYALQPHGFLMIGPAETTGVSSSMFKVVDEEQRIYARNTVVGPPRLLSVARGVHPSWESSGGQVVPKRPSASNAAREADRTLLARFAPAAVLVDDRLRILEFRGDTGPFLDHGQGKASLNLERLLRRGLLIQLRQALEEARRTNATVRRDGLQVHYRRELRGVSIEVIPIRGQAATERCWLILFEGNGVGPEVAEARGPVSRPGEDATAVDEQEISPLSQTLDQTTDYMHSLVREHEAALETLQLTTEEALSNNEELQSVNEELQTAKEEIQSSNEELATLNQELHDRNARLARSNDQTRRGLDSANALVEMVPQPLVIVDEELRLEKANAALYATFGLSAERTRNQPLSELGGGQWNQPDLLRALNRVLTRGVTVEELETEAEFPGVGVRIISHSARRLHPQGSGRGRVLLGIVDRTDAKRSERGREALLALEQNARTRAEAADKMKDQFVATVSHELRGPLAVISGWTDVLLAAGGNPDAAMLAKALAAIGRGVKAQGRLISELLDHSRIVTGKLELQRMAINLVAVAEAALEGVRAAAEAKDIELRLSADPATSTVLGDADRMQQVLWNLILNAVKFTPAGGSVWIAVRRVHNQVHVTVSDTGRGIPAEFLPHVFDRFRQDEGSSARTQPGLGLGLTLVRELVELHGGTVRAESPGRDRGATFTVVLPIPAVLLSAPEEGPSLAPESERLPSPQPPVSLPDDVLSGVTVLVVDDEVDAREALVGLLERYGARVHSAASVTEAMAALEEASPDVLITDLGMPGEDGYELIRRVRLLPAARGGLLPSLAVSAYATREHRRKVVESGFQKHLEKPVTPVDLVTSVATLAGHAGSSDGPLLHLR